MLDSSRRMPFVNFAQRLAHRAQAALIALRLGVLGEAVGQDDRPVDASRITSSARDFVRVARQPVAAVGALLGKQQARLHQLLQDLRKQRQRDPIRVRNVLGATRSLAPVAKCRRAISP